MYNVDDIIGRNSIYFPPTDKPSPPRNLAAVQIDKEQITVTWEPSEDDGGEPITAYTVERRNVDKQTWIKVCNTLSQI